MLNFSKLAFAWLISCCFMFGMNSLSVAQEPDRDRHRSAISPFLAEDVVAFAYLDLTELQLQPVFKKMAKLGIIDQDEVPAFDGIQKMLQAQIDGLTQVGVDSVYVFARLDDFNSGSASIRVTLSDGADVEKAMRMVRLLIKSSGFDLKNIVAGKGSILLGNSKRQIEILKQQESGKLKAVSLDEEVWELLGQGTAAVVVMADPDSRRVIRELMPELPKPFNSISGELIADHLKWVGLELTANQKTQGAKLIVESQDEETAKVVKETLGASLGLLGNFVNLGKAGEATKALTNSLAPSREGNRVMVSTDQLMENFDGIAQNLRLGLAGVRKMGVGKVRANRLRTQALAALNYESAMRNLPPLASVDDNGKPLLSWRVMVLPFTEHNELYQQFKLDEPWDSEHNLKLVKKMPLMYCDPDPMSTQNNLDGLTVYQAADGNDDFLLKGDPATFFKDVTDGSSNTMMFAVVAPKHAVPWTKPADWEVDQKSPTEKLKYPGRKVVEVVTCDGAGHEISLDMPVDWWRKFLMRNDGAPIRW